MKRSIKVAVATLAVLAGCIRSPLATASETNPKSYVATASGDNTLLAAEAGRAYTIHAIAVIATSDTAVSFYVRNGDNMLLGNATNKVTIDQGGVSGPAGFILPYNPQGWMAADTAGEAVAINLSAAVPVIVLVLYSLR